MPKFTFICDHNDTLGPGPVITVETERLFLDEVLFDIQDFLKGAGFVFDGELQIVSTEEIYGTKADETVTESKGCGGCGHCGNKERIYESPDKGQTVYARNFGSTERENIR